MSVTIPLNPAVRGGLKELEYCVNFKSNLLTAMSWQHIVSFIRVGLVDKSILSLALVAHAVGKMEIGFETVVEGLLSMARGLK